MMNAGPEYESLDRRFQTGSDVGVSEFAIDLSNYHRYYWARLMLVLVECDQHNRRLIAEHLGTGKKMQKKPDAGTVPRVEYLEQRTDGAWSAP